MTVRENVSLTELNTFRVSANARWFAEINREQDIEELFADPRWSDCRQLILGGGSNILFRNDFNGLIIHMNIPGIEAEARNEDIFVTAGAGVVWNDLVNYCVDHGYAGIENLSLIPGSAGAAPVQNIGAYGVELQDVFHSCRAFEIATRTFRSFNKEECRFSYRDSIFKSEYRGHYIICSITLKLSRVFNPDLSYGAIRQELESRNIKDPGIKDISAVVSHIRISKLPDPATIGNAGSFFKNPIIPVDKFVQLQSDFPDIVHFPAGEGLVKLAAGWLIEQCGWKGKVIGRTGTWKNQALVVVNNGQATGNEIFMFSCQIIQSVKARFDVTLEREVNII
jgi:UDP-N-acetylmuramate dehydrogenase